MKNYNMTMPVVLTLQPVLSRIVQTSGIQATIYCCMSNGVYFLMWGMVCTGNLLSSGRVEDNNGRNADKQSWSFKWSYSCLTSIWMKYLTSEKQELSKLQDWEWLTWSMLEAASKNTYWESTTCVLKSSITSVKPSYSKPLTYKITRNRL